jgi:hypothetical protein
MPPGKSAGRPLQKQEDAPFRSCGLAVVFVANVTTKNQREGNNSLEYAVLRRWNDICFVDCRMVNAESRMIHVIEFPEQGRAHAWFAFEKQDLMRKICATDALDECEIFDVATPGELLEMHGRTQHDAADEFPGICSLGDLHGWDTPLYRADCLLGEGVFRTEAVAELDAHVAALTRRNVDIRIYWSDTEAVSALENDVFFQSREGFRAGDALREQLVSLEILEGV